jgi:hypothetical protein
MEDDDAELARAIMLSLQDDGAGTSSNSASNIQPHVHSRVPPARPPPPSAHSRQQQQQQQLEHHRQQNPSEEDGGSGIPIRWVEHVTCQNPMCRFTQSSASPTTSIPSRCPRCGHGYFTTTSDAGGAATTTTTSSTTTTTTSNSSSNTQASLFPQRVRSASSEAELEKVAADIKRLADAGGTLTDAESRGRELAPPPYAAAVRGRPDDNPTTADAVLAARFHRDAERESKRARSSAVDPDVAHDAAARDAADAATDAAIAAELQRVFDLEGTQGGAAAAAVDRGGGGGGGTGVGHEAADAAIALKLQGELDAESARQRAADEEQSMRLALSLQQRENGIGGGGAAAAAAAPGGGGGGGAAAAEAWRTALPPAGTHPAASQAAPHAHDDATLARKIQADLDAEQARQLQSEMDNAHEPMQQHALRGNSDDGGAVSRTTSVPLETQLRNEEIKAKSVLDRILATSMTTGELFVDPDFPPTTRSLYLNGHSPRGGGGGRHSGNVVRWSDPVRDQRLSRHYLAGGHRWCVFAGDPRPEDVSQGGLGNCWCAKPPLLSSLVYPLDIELSPRRYLRVCPTCCCVVCVDFTERCTHGVLCHLFFILGFTFGFVHFPRIFLTFRLTFSVFSFSFF